MSAFRDTLTVGAGATYLDVTHNLGSATHYVTGLLANWSTALSWSNKAANTTRIDFTNPAPTGGGLLDVRIET